MDSSWMVETCGGLWDHGMLVVVVVMVVVMVVVVVGDMDEMGGINDGMTMGHG
jgi:hypothetical protein